MIFVLGIIVGLLLALTLLILEVYLTYKPSKLVETIQAKAQGRQKGQVILPPDEVTEAREKLIKQKHDVGLDFYLDDLS